jgi:hypothetical protein
VRRKVARRRAASGTKDFKPSAQPTPKLDPSFRWDDDKT